MTPTEVRSRLIENGYVPVPCDGKNAKSEQWERRTLETAQTALTTWARDFPNASNTGMLCVTAPTLDIDVLDAEAVDAAVILVQERFAGRGKILLRYGRRPKVAIPFQTDTPFKKISVPLTAADGDTDQKIEFLAMGQQVVVHGVHPVTHEMYQWIGGNPGDTKRAELPAITVEEAQALVDDIATLTEARGYQRTRKPASKRGKPKGNGHAGSVDAPSGIDQWGYLQANIIAGRALHDSIRDLAIRLVTSGMSGGAAVNMLRGLMEQSEAARNERCQARYDDIPRAVRGAERFPRENEEREPTPPLGEHPPERVPGVPRVPIAADEGATILDDAFAYVKRFVSYPSEHARVAHVLWCAHTHLIEAFESTGRLALLSPEPESGKTRALEATEPLVARPISTVNASAAYLFRKAGDDAGPPTVLFDEIDTIFGPKAKEHEDIRGFINAGHRRGATYGRCVVHGSTVVTEEVPVYSAVAMAGLGWLPDTLLSRSIIIRMRRRLKTETIEPFRQRIHVREGQAIGQRLAVWAKPMLKNAEAARPELPAGVEDRQADAWEPLLVVADLVGGEWPQKAREAAAALVTVARETPVSLNLRLLEDLRTVFLNRLTAVEQAQPPGLSTKKILDDLCTLEDSPWQTINKGERLSPDQLSRRLRDYSVKRTNLRLTPGVREQTKGYPIAPLADAWRRYLSLIPCDAVPPVTPVTEPTLERYFEIAPGTEGTEGTLPQEEREGISQLDKTRVEQLAKWWRKRMGQLRGELSPALAEEQAKKELRETLANEVLDSAVDTEVDRVEKAATRRT
ncbi:DUF3631 domain-containing protein [Bradyrhizobium sp. UFLA05-109]